MFEGKVWILENLYEKTEEMEPFNKYGEDLSYNRTESHFLYESDSMPVVMNKQNFDKREETLGNVRSSFRQELFITFYHESVPENTFCYHNFLNKRPRAF